MDNNLNQELCVELYTKIADLLAKREYTRFYLSKKFSLLAQYSPAIVKQVLDRLEEEGFLDDARYTASYIRACVSRGRGPRYIKHKLYQQGVHEDIINSGIQNSATDWALLGESVRIKKFGGAQPTTVKEQMQQQQFLYTRGFYNSSSYINI